MNHRKTRIFIFTFLLLSLAAFGLGRLGEARQQKPAPKSDVVMSAETKMCVACHRTQTPVIVQQWESSKHAKMGTGC